MSILDELSSPEQQATQPPAEPSPQGISSGPSKPSGPSILDTLLQSQPPSETVAPQQTEGVISDIAKSAAIGVPKGLIQAVGTPGDIANLFPSASPETKREQAAAWAAYAPGMEIPKEDVNYVPLPTSQDIQKKVEEYTGPFYKPQTSPGKFVETTTSFLANPLSYLGPGSLALKAATTTGAALASEAAGQLTEGLGPIETAARLTAGLIGGHIPNSVSKAVTRSALRNAATVDDLFNASGNLYEKSYSSGVNVKPSAGSDWSYDIISDLRKDGFRPYTPATEAAFRTIGELGQTVNQQGMLGIPEIDTIRKALGRIAGSPDREARAIARYGISKIDENVSNLANNPSWIATGQQNAPQVSSDITQARAAYAAAMRSSMLEDAFDSALEKASRRAGSTGKGGNIENTMRQEIRTIVNSPTKRRGFSSDEIAALTDIVKGGEKANLLRGIGALAPTGIVSGTLGLELGHLLFGGAKAMFGVPLVGMAAKKLGEAQTRKAIEDVAARTRMRGFAGPPPPTYTPAHGYMAPLFSSTQSRGGAIKRALNIAKKHGRKD